MKLSKQIRKQLFAGEVVELDYGSSENPPLRTGASYAISTPGAIAATHKCRVLRQRPVEDGWKVVVALDTQEPARLLAREGGYTEFAGRALREEPEAVDEVTQERFSELAEEREAERRKQRKLERERNSLEARIGIARKVAEVRQVDISPKVRMIRHQLEKIEQQLDGELDRAA